MLLFVGLGNPGPKYAGNRHNIGFMAVQAIARRHELSPWRRRFQGVAVEGNIGDERVLLLLPGTYMNKSGRAVAEAANFYKIEPGNIVVFHDEVDLPAAKVGVKVGGGVAGHNGLRSITAHVGNDYQARPHRHRQTGGQGAVPMHVLGDFAKGDWAWIEALFESLPTMLPFWSGRGLNVSEQGVSRHGSERLRR